MTTAVSFLQQQGDSINVLLIAVKRPDVWDEQRLSIRLRWYIGTTQYRPTPRPIGHNINASIHPSSQPSIYGFQIYCQAVAGSFNL